MLIEALENERKELSEKIRAEISQKIRAELFSKIREEISQKVELTQKEEFARKLLMKRFDLPLIAELTDLSEEKILQLRQEMEN